MGKSEITCDCEVIHSDVVEKLKTAFPQDELIFELADFYKIFGDTTRVRILYALNKAELCVCDISESLDMTQSAVSHQLQILRTNKLVKSRREGKQMYYSLADEHVVTIIAQGLSHILE